MCFVLYEVLNVNLIYYGVEINSSDLFCGVCMLTSGMNTPKVLHGQCRQLQWVKQKCICSVLLDTALNSMLTLAWEHALNENVDF